MRQLACAVMVLVACGGDDGGAKVDGGHDATVDGAPADAAPDQRIASGTHLVPRPSIVAGLTNDGYVVFGDTNADGHSVAKVIPLGGGEETTIATSSGTGKGDIRFQIDGDVVFVFTDRGNRVSTLTIWSAATGVIAKGSGARPGRAAASSDGTFIAYETDITSTTASLVAGPIDGSATVVDTANTSNNDCWMQTDIEEAGRTVGQGEILFRYCQGSATNWTLRAVGETANATALSTSADEATYRDTHVVWRETSGALLAQLAGSASAVTLAANAVDYVVSPDETQVAWIDTTGAILEAPITGSGSARTLVAGPLAKQIGALSPDNTTVLFASQVSALGSGDVQPYTNVLAARAGSSPITLVGSAESCAGCIHDSFTPDSSDALVLDPVDNSEVADVAGPIHTFSLADGTSISSFGQTTWSAVALTGGGSGAAARFVALDGVRDSALSDGWAWQLSTTTLEPGAAQTIIARGAESFVIDAARTHALTSFPGSDGIAGVYVVDLTAP